MIHSARSLPAALIALALATAALPSSGCVPAPRAPVRIAVSPWPGYEYLVLAHELGFFEQEGVDVRIVELESLGDSRSAFENGQADVFGGTLVELLVCRAQSPRRPQAFYAVDFSDGADMLLADSTVHTIADLRGRAIAVEAASTDVIALAGALAGSGMTLRDVRVAPMPQSGKPGAMNLHTVQAAQCFPPVSNSIASLPGVHQIFDSSQIPNAILDVLVADSAWIASNGGRLAAVVRALSRAQAWARENENEALAMMAAREHLSSAEMREALAGLRIVPLAEQRAHLAPGGPTVRAIELTHRALADMGTIPAIPNLSALTTPRVAAQARR